MNNETCFVCVQFGSWAYNGFALNLVQQEGVAGMDTSEYLVNGEWTLDCMLHMRV